MKVKAAVARVRGAPLRIEDLELEEPRDDEILVKMIASGVARADLDAIEGRLAMPLPFVPGSEGAGIVERTGSSVAGLETGDAVIISYDSCGSCDPCATRRPRACLHFASLNLSGRPLDGARPFAGDDGPVNGRFFGQSSFATHIVCRAGCATKVSKGAPLETLACLGGEVLLGAGLILHGLAVSKGDSLVVTGANAIGLIATMVAKARGAGPIIVADPHERRREIASAVGADITVHGFGDLDDIVRSVEADGACYAFETTGEDAARRACLSSLTADGTCAFVDMPPDAPHDYDDQIGENQRLVLSVDGHAPPATLIAELVALRDKATLPLEQMIDFFPLEQVNDAIDALRRGEVAKPVLRFSLGGFGELDRALVEGAANDPPAEETPPRPVEQDEKVSS